MGDLAHDGGGDGFGSVFSSAAGHRSLPQPFPLNVTGGAEKILIISSLQTTHLGVDGMSMILEVMVNVVEQVLQVKS